MLEIKEIRKRYKNKIEALKGVSVKIGKGETMSFFGENGAGKTTLLKIIATFLIPDSGKILLNNVDLLKNQKYAKEKITISTGIERSFYYRLTVKQNLEFFGMLNGLLGKALKMTVERVIEETALSEYTNIKYMELSKGLKRRLDIARALLKEAEVYIFDETTSGVDIKTQQKIYELIEELVQKKKIVLFATHEIEELKKIDKIVILQKGRKIGELNVREHKEIETILLKYV
ncbi:multidrug ABC transporter ATP-binding protein [Thermosipho melanesiensis]|uniref:ABC transporter related n=2 Tax=Thermosipho melanesiensis TaxID=46541 RepID=A6LK24_THEM4|nr:ATP-binding cassette domain-containing protein [Thermosipho melanesiensis]ABR30275.1 ABC transporter related [Thermosipho melanesiensis BI429]APT73455.1 multidrug ABC transporter ATP-binding protein [Thermosipho melanesiensis]OOC37401.1 multidrug ABC transporter ATP-binding protein [Thermosipho melanesiensis]OOC39763.1 multidrug ABC transporter ATP-binding protein [Thermosipho melanesiensis]OOC39868.1 multidrug ABC transporter ATP-binding protein [Thermosipho melanesiensis]